MKFKVWFSFLKQFKKQKIKKILIFNIKDFIYIYRLFFYGYLIIVENKNSYIRKTNFEKEIETKSIILQIFQEIVEMKIYVGKRRLFKIN